MKLKAADDIYRAFAANMFNLDTEGETKEETSEEKEEGEVDKIVTHKKKDKLVKNLADPHT